jgi:hypothetical protein
MIKNVLSDIGGVGIYGVISISIFFLVFLAALVRVCLMTKAFVHQASTLPLEDGDPTAGPAATSTTPSENNPSRNGDSRHE